MSEHNDTYVGFLAEFYLCSRNLKHEQTNVFHRFMLSERSEFIAALLSIDSLHLQLIM